MRLSNVMDTPAAGVLQPCLRQADAAFPVFV